MGIVANMVINGYNGYKATNKDSFDLAKGIETIFQCSGEEIKQFNDNASKQVENYSSLESAGVLLNSVLFKKK
jgi:hypothetical protein